MKFDRLLFAVTLSMIGFASLASSTGFGVNAHIPSGPVTERIEAAGIEWVRIDFLWLFVEPERDVYDWSIYDALVDRLEGRGLRIFAGLGATPEWATSGPEFSGVPNDVDQWREFCYLVARRYSGRIQAWGLWNEPNLDRFWEGTRQEYIDVILLPGAEAIHLADPSALVCAPDLAHLSSADWDDWLSATIHAAGDQIDVVTHHVYPSNGFASEVTYDLETGGPFPFSPPSVESVLKDSGWWRRPFWLTETGVQSSRWGEGRQRSFVENLLTQWFSPSRGHRSWVDRLFFYEMNDSPSPSTYSYGLLYGPTDLNPKEAYLAYSQYITNAEVDDAMLVNSDLPRYFQYGETTKATITFRNTGTTAWSSEQLSFLAVEINSLSWSIEVDQLSGNDVVEPGETHEFRISVTPPGGSLKIGEPTVLSARMERVDAWPFGDLLRQEIELVSSQPPRIIHQPESSLIARGASANLLVEAQGSQPLSFQWLRNGIVLVDSEIYSGAETSSLTVTALSYEIAAFYQCVVSNPTGGAVSNAAVVSIGQPAPRSGSGRVLPDGNSREVVWPADTLRFSGPPNQR